MLKETYHYTSAVYQIKLKGEITTSLLNFIEDMQLQQELGQNVITLVGRLPDQSALLGLLNALNGIRYEIVSVRILSTD